jgi:hydrogenase nickel incorporation protein HypB
VTEGDDKPIKYPHMFQAANMLIINKIDLLPYVEFELARCQVYARQVNPAIEIMTLSTATGEGLETWFDWISAASRRERGGTFPQLLEALP